MTHVGIITKTWGSFNGPSPEVVLATNRYVRF